MKAIHDAVRNAYEAFQEREGRNAPAYLAARIGKAVATCYQWAEGGDEARRNINVVDAILVTNELHDYSIVRAIAAATDCILTPLPTSKGNIEHGALRQTVTEFHELVDAVFAANEDGCISAAEAKEIETQGYQAMEAIRSLIEDAKRRSVDLDAVRVAESHKPRLVRSM